MLEVKKDVPSPYFRTVESLDSGSKRVLANSVLQKGEQALHEVAVLEERMKDPREKDKLLRKLGGEILDVMGLGLTRSITE